MKNKIIMENKKLLTEEEIEIALRGCYTCQDKRMFKEGMLAAEKIILEKLGKDETKTS